MSKVYRVEMDGALLVIASSSLDAQTLAKSSLSEIVNSGSFKAVFHVREMRTNDKKVFADKMSLIPYNTGSFTGSLGDWIDENELQIEHTEYLRLQTKFSGS